MDESDKAKFDACMRIVEFTAGRRRDREAYEWKFTIAFWTVIVLATEFFHANDFPDNTLAMRVVVGLIVLALYGLVWLRSVHAAHAQDRARGQHFLKEAEKIAQAAGVAAHSEAGGKPVKYWGLIFQLLVTVLLLAAFVFFAGRWYG
jgi:hypothetical protein